MSWLARREHFQHIAKTIDPSIRIYPKNNWYFRLYAKLPWLGEEFLRQTASVIGPLHFYPEGWDDIEKELYHEGRHTWQQRVCGLGIHPWVGFIPYAILTSFCLPVGLKVSFWFELDAEAYALEHKYKTGSNAAYVRNELVDFAKLLSTAHYGWAWPRPWAVAAAKRKAYKLMGRKK